MGGGRTTAKIYMNEMSGRRTATEQALGRTLINQCSDIFLFFVAKLLQSHCYDMLLQSWKTHGRQTDIEKLCQRRPTDPIMRHEQATNAYRTTGAIQHETNET